MWGEENSELVKNAIDLALKGENSKFSALCYTFKGTPKYWDVSLSPVGEPGDSIKQIISVSRVITHKK